MSYLHLSDKHAEAHMKKAKVGKKMKLVVHGTVRSMESRSDMGDVFSPEGKTKKASKPKQRHHMEIDVESAEPAPDNEAAE